jgi:diguanylate cyclase (GGDEF)-like protein
MGGEEFALLLPLTDAAGAQQVAERIRQRIQSQAFDWQGQAWPLSASLGVACAEPADASAEAVLERADRAMYAAKAAGRNRVRLG